jgi:hypothetical protein
MHPTHTRDSFMILACSIKAQIPQSIKIAFKETYDPAKKNKIKTKNFC